MILFHKQVKQKSFMKGIGYIICYWREIMKTLKELCIPRDSVFDSNKTSDVLDLTDLVEDKIDPEEFFKENFVTDGMDILLKTAFERFNNKNSHGLILLSQSMGGGKTHNMIALGLLAKHPHLRNRVLGDDISYSGLDEINVVCFTGRETDVPFGIWGSIAEQLGKKDLFKEYYSPLSAPGQKAWMNLLKGKPTLILLDELPPYLEHARARPIGDSNLASVTGVALANLFNALNKRDGLSNVLVVISDLKAAYESGGRLLQSTFKDLESEMSRIALPIIPVDSSSDEIFDILKKRLFSKLPSESKDSMEKNGLKNISEDQDVIEISTGYKKSLEEAKQMGFTNASADKLFLGIRQSYPFHPSIRELYERFKENEGFQQTRGLIRLMRRIVNQLWESKSADNKFLINSYDFDLNEPMMHTMITRINSSLSNAITHDIANKGKAVAEYIDKENNESNSSDLAKLILVSSLADVPNALLGLSFSEMVSYLVEPDKDISQIKKTIERLIDEVWYLHPDKDGKYYFKNTRNLNAELKSLVASYDDESAKKELRNFLIGGFKPVTGDCYQNVNVFPPFDEIDVVEDKINLILTEPYTNGGLNPKLIDLFNDTQYKNRLMFLSGERNTMDNLLNVAKEHKAILRIIHW